MFDTLFYDCQVSTKEVLGRLRASASIALRINKQTFPLLFSLLEALRKNSSHNDLHEHAFAYGLYQLHNFVLCGSIFLTVALALERYRAVWRPIEYHNQCVGVNPWRRVLVSYLLPVVVFSTVHTIPKFFEVEMLVKADYEVIKSALFNETDNTTYDYEVSSSKMVNF